RSDRDPMPPRTISVALGTRVLLDEMTGDPKNCVTVVRLEAAVVRPPVRSGLSSGRGGGGGGVSSGGGGASGVGVSPRPGASGGGGDAVAAGAVSGGGRGGAVLGIANGRGPGSSAAMFATAMGMAELGTVTKNGVPTTDHSVKMHPIDDASYDAEVWLV